MAAPLPNFYSYADLKGVLRLSKIIDNGDADLQLAAAVREVWTIFWRRMGHARIVVLKAITHSDTPSTDNDYLRLLAETTESNCVRVALLKYFVAKFADGGGLSLQEWNQEGFVRNTNAFAIQKEITSLETAIEEAFVILAGEQSANASTIQASTPTTEDMEANGPVVLGETIFGGRGKGGIFGPFTPHQ